MRISKRQTPPTITETATSHIVIKFNFGSDVVFISTFYNWSINVTKYTFTLIIPRFVSKADLSESTEQPKKELLNESTGTWHCFEFWSHKFTCCHPDHMLRVFRTMYAGMHNINLYLKTLFWLILLLRKHIFSAWSTYLSKFLKLNSKLAFCFVSD